MNVLPVLSTLDVTATGAASKSKTAQTSGATALTTDVYSSKIAEIAAKYDVTHISLDQVPALGRELLKNGLISGAACCDMIIMPSIQKDLEKKGLSLGNLTKGSDGAVDLLEYWKDAASHQRSPEATEEMQHTAETFEALSSYKTAASGSGGITASTSQGAVNLHGAIFAYQSGIDHSSLDAQQVVNVLEALVQS